MKSLVSTHISQVSHLENFCVCVCVCVCVSVCVCVQPSENIIKYTFLYILIN